MNKFNKERGFTPTPIISNRSEIIGVGLQRKRGFIGTIFLIIIGLALLKYFLNWSIFDAAASEEGRGTISYVRDILNTLWSYLATPVNFIWNEVVWPLLTLLLNSLKNN